MSILCQSCREEKEVLRRQILRMREALKEISEGGLFNPAKYQSIAREALSKVSKP